jgi:hypothetical protein
MFFDLLRWVARQFAPLRLRLSLLLLSLLSPGRLGEKKTCRAVYLLGDNMAHAVSTETARFGRANWGIAGDMAALLRGRAPPPALCFRAIYLLLVFHFDCVFVSVYLLHRLVPATGPPAHRFEVEGFFLCFFLDF